MMVGPGALTGFVPCGKILILCLHLLAWLSLSL